MQLTNTGFKRPSTPCHLLKQTVRVPAAPRRHPSSPDVLQASPFAGDGRALLGEARQHGGRRQRRPSAPREPRDDDGSRGQRDEDGLRRLPVPGESGEEAAVARPADQGGAAQAGELQELEEGAEEAVAGGAARRGGGREGEGG